MSEDAFLRSAADVAASLGSDPEQGLTQREAADRLRRDGPNELPIERPPAWWRILGRQFRDVLIWILIAAIALSFWLGDHVEAAAIGVITTFTVVLGFVQELRAQRAMDALQQLAAPHARVLRGGQVTAIPAREVVAGDIVMLSQGDVVPADGRLLQAIELSVAESALTGESEAVSKSVEADVPADAAIGDRTNMVHASTQVARGRGIAVITATGADTEVGHIGRLLHQVKEQPTPLERQLAQMGRWLIGAGSILIAVIVAVGIARGEAIGDMVVFGIALAVAAVPEALPAVVTISLAVGAGRMAKRNALVRRLPTVEALGSTTVICSDKTGTLTTGRMAVTELYIAGATVAAADASTANPEALGHAMHAAALCSDATETDGEPTEVALVAAAAGAGFAQQQLAASHTRIAEQPFSSASKYMVSLHRHGDTTVAYAKGAPSVVLGGCDHAWTAAGRVPLGPSERAAILAVVTQWAERGRRVLALAYQDGAESSELDGHFTFAGLAAIQDPPRPEATAAIRRCKEAGIRPVMITGDHAATARAIADELGITSSGITVTGPELTNGDDHQAGRADVYARVSPEHKLRIIGALQADGHIVAMTGDGVNDAPALRQADIGVAMGITGTDVAKQAAPMILADDNFASIVAAVEEGRVIFDNVRKYLVYLLSTNFGELALIATTMLLGLPLPLTAVMILYINLASDGLPAIALAVDPPEPDRMKRGPRPPGAAILDSRIVALMVIGGLWAAGAALAIFLYAQHIGHAMARAMTMTLATVAITQFVMGYSFRTERASILRRPFANKWYNAAIAWELILLSMVVYVPFLQRLFGTVAISGADWLLIGAAVASVVPVLEGLKWGLRVARLRQLNGASAPN